MKKILLIEDRTKRQNDFLSELNIDLTHYESILDNKIDSQYSQFLQEIKDNTFNLNIYEIIIAHESIFIGENRVVLNKLKAYCKVNKKTLVLFSGSNSNSYNNEEYEELGLISSDLYSENLVLFLEEFQKGNKNILILSYGKQWKLNIVLNILEKVFLFIELHKDEDDIDFDEFQNFSQSYLLNNLEIGFYNLEVDGSWVNLSEIIKLKENILEHIKEMADE